MSNLGVEFWSKTQHFALSSNDIRKKSGLAACGQLIIVFPRTLCMFLKGTEAVLGLLTMLETSVARGGAADGS